MLQRYMLCMQDLIKDITQTVDELSYIDPEYVSVGFKRSKDNVNEETWAEVTALDLGDGAYLQKKEGRVEKYFSSQCLLMNGVPVKYIMDFYVPVFLSLPFREKLVTVFHELYHISPNFDGELRTFKGRAYQHGPSKEKYDKYMEYLCDKYMREDREAVEFLKEQPVELMNLCKGPNIPKYSKPEQQLYRVTWC